MKVKSFTGPYDALYASSPRNILWPSAPSHLMAKLMRECSRGDVLDAGCGDGVNALFLEQAGFSVHGIDVSRIALAGLLNRFAQHDAKPRGRYVCADIHGWRAKEDRYVALVSCGLYQCLDRGSRHSIHRRLQRSLTEKGLVLFSCLTNTLPMPPDHLTSGIELVDISEVRDLFQGMSIEYFREGVIKDRHGDLVGNHEHSVVWVVARNTTSFSETGADTPRRLG